MTDRSVSPVHGAAHSTRRGSPAPRSMHAWRRAMRGMLEALGVEPETVLGQDHGVAPVRTRVGDVQHGRGRHG